MKILCKNEYLTKAVHYVERVVGKNTTLPILTTILLDVKNGEFSATATNLEVGVVTKIPAKIEKEGGIAVPARILGGFVQTLVGGGEVSLEVRGGAVLIRSGAQSATIKGMDAQEFPIIPKQKRGHEGLALPAQDIKRAIERVLPFTSLNETRPELTGVSMSFEGGKIFFAATDSFRLGESGVEIKGLGDEGAHTPQAIIIPAVACQELLRLIGQEEQTLILTIQEKQLFFTLPSTILVSRLIDGKYPDYRQIIPRSTATDAVVRADGFLRSIKAAALFTQSAGGEVALDVLKERGLVEVAAQSQEAGGSSATIPATIQGEPQRIVLNPRYLMDGVAAIGTPWVHIDITSSASPVLFRGSDGEGAAPHGDFLYIVMPIKNQ